MSVAVLHRCKRKSAGSRYNNIQTAWLTVYERSLSQRKYNLHLFVHYKLTHARGTQRTEKNA